MARFEITGPDGGRYEITAPDNASEQEVFQVFSQQMGGAPEEVPPVDFNRPVEAVRADIAKLPEGQRQKALDKWADAYVAKERKEGTPLLAADNVLRTVARGTFVGPFLDEFTAKAASRAHELSGGRIGSPYDETLAYQRARDRAVDTSYPVASTLGKVAGGVAGGVGAARAGSGLMSFAAGGPLAAWSPSASMAGRIGQGAAVGSTYGAGQAFGNAEGGFDNRLDAAQQGAIVGGIVGAAAPPVLEVAGRGIRAAGDYMAPTAARWGQELRNRGILAESRPKSAGAAAVTEGAPPTSGADAAAEEMIANQLLRSNVSARDLRARWAAADEASRFHTSGRAQNVMAAADLDPSLARLAGSAGRQNTEAFNYMKAFQEGRQTGQTPQGMGQRELADVGIPTRAPMAPPVRGGKYAEQTLGRRFDTVDADSVPMGQFERVRDALKRAFLISDEKFHQHAKNAYRQEESLIQAAREEAKDLYGQAYKAAAGVDLRPTLNPVLEKWSGQLIDEPQPVARQLQRAMKLFQRAMSPEGQKPQLERVQKVKEMLDDVIDGAFTSTNGRQRYLGGKLTEFKNEVLDALDKMPKVGPQYAAARAAFSDKMQAKEAIELGRAAIRENSDVAADQIMAIPEGPMRKLVRLGMLDQLERDAAKRGRNQDITAVFNTPRMQEILQAAIPRSDKSGVFANRPERFGQYVQDQRAMLATRDTTLGGSPTARNMQDDQAMNGLSALQRFRQSGSVLNVAIDAVGDTLTRMFGMRADTAASLARQLFNADPAARQRLLLSLERRMGTDRAAAIAQILRDYERMMTMQAGGLAGGAAGGALGAP